MFSVSKSLAKLKSRSEKSKNVKDEAGSSETKELKKEPQKKGTSKKKSVKPKKQKELIPGVIFLRNIPHGFYEEPLLKYFSQFGTVTRLRLSRNRKVYFSYQFAPPL